MGASLINRTIIGLGTRSSGIRIAVKSLVEVG